MKEIDESIPGFLIPIVWPKVRGAKAVESWIHNRGSWIRFRFVGSGKTEYFLSLILLLSIPVTLIVWCWQRFTELLFALFIIWAVMGFPNPYKWMY